MALVYILANRQFHRNHIIFADPGSGDVIALDPHPTTDGQNLQVVATNHDPAQIVFIEESFEAFIGLIENSIRNNDPKLFYRDRSLNIGSIVY